MTKTPLTKQKSSGVSRKLTPSKAKLVISGSVAMDQIMSFSGAFAELIQPDKLHVLSVAPMVQKMIRTDGGTAGNMCYSLALMGDRPMLFASVGQDAAIYLEKLRKIGVDVSQVNISHLPTATFSVLTDRNDCQVGGFYPGAMTDSASLSFVRLIKEKLATKKTLFVVSVHDPAQMINQVDECHNNHLRLLFDVGQQIHVLNSDQLMLAASSAELLIMNDYEMGVFSKKTGLNKQQIAAQAKTCIVTLGSAGAEIFTKTKKGDQQVQRISAVKLEHPADPTGAGDAFRAGFLYGYLRDWSVKLSAELGAVVASFAVEKHGTQEHRLSWPAIEERYQQTYGKKLSRTH
ncbi:MAG: carbohydrate kinase family protein [Patescibacteria group bacterium]